MVHDTMIEKSPFISEIIGFVSRIRDILYADHMRFDLCHPYMQFIDGLILVVLMQL